MTRLVIDSRLLQQLQAVDRDVELCDETGKTVGHFVPEAEYVKRLYDRARQLFTDDELDRARKQGGGKSLAEIWESLGAK